MDYCDEFMKKALSLAKRAYKTDEVPVGAVIARDGEIISACFNHKEHSSDATAHAEILAIKRACKKVGDFRLCGCDIYVTLEPCVMCMGAILNARIDNLYFGASISNGSISAEEICEKANLNHKTIVSGGYRSEECSKLLSDYFKEKRKK